MHLTAWPWVSVASDVICLLKHDFENVPRQNCKVSRLLSHPVTLLWATKHSRARRSLESLMHACFQDGTRGGWGWRWGRESWGKQVCSPLAGSSAQRLSSRNPSHHLPFLDLFLGSWFQIPLSLPRSQLHL